MTNAQTWLNENIPLNQRNNIYELYIWPSNLLEFSNFRRLESLFLGTNDRERISQGIYNRWNGSLQHIQNLTDLRELNINSTDINDGLEYLPTKELFHFTFGNVGRIRAGVNRLRAILIQDLEIEFEGDETAESWALEGTYSTDDSLDNCAGKVEDIREWQTQFIGQRPQLQTQIQVNNSWLPSNRQ